MLEPTPAWAISSGTLVILVGLGSGLATFVASVMGDEQDQRLKNGTFGAVAGTSIGGLAGLMTKQADLLVVGFFGSVVGAFLGWLVYFALAWLASATTTWRRILDFQVGGLGAVKKSLELDDQKQLLEALEAWRGDFTRMLLNQKAEHYKLEGPSFKLSSYLTIESWIVSVVDFSGFFFETLAKKKNYRSRVTVIVYGKRDGTVVGCHWIKYSGQLAPYRTEQSFDSKSIGYQVLTSRLSSPHFTTSVEAQQTGQKREDDPSYRPFYTFRLNDSAVMALDWPNELNADRSDPFVDFARGLFHSIIAQAIGETLDRWSQISPLAYEVGLDPLQ